jgi:hypothetical protein
MTSASAGYRTGSERPDGDRDNRSITARMERWSTAVPRSRYRVSSRSGPSLSGPVFEFFGEEFGVEGEASFGHGEVGGALCSFAHKFAPLFSRGQPLTSWSRMTWPYGLIRPWSPASKTFVRSSLPVSWSKQANKSRYSPSWPTMRPLTSVLAASGGHYGET